MSEAEPARDLHAVLERVRDGAGVIVEHEQNLTSCKVRHKARQKRSSRPLAHSEHCRDRFGNANHNALTVRA